MFTETVLCEIIVSSKTKHNYKVTLLYVFFQFSSMSGPENTSYISSIKSHQSYWKTPLLHPGERWMRHIIFVFNKTIAMTSKALKGVSEGPGHQGNNSVLLENLGIFFFFGL